MLAQTGFDPEDALLPWPARSFTGFRLLSEYFALPEKFLFFDILRLDAKTLRSAGNRLTIYVYLDRAAPELERVVGADTLALGCTPVINLFPHRCEPVTLTHTATEYRMEPDVRRPGALEIWQVERVLETRADGSSRPWQPFYRLQQAAAPRLSSSGFYAIARRPSASLSPDRTCFSNLSTRPSMYMRRPMRCSRSKHFAATVIWPRNFPSAAAARC